MENNAKVFVFEKKELFLIFVFVVIMSITCFTLGVNLGKKLAFEKSGVLADDVRVVELKSTLEEEAEKTLAAPELSDEEKLKKLMDESKEKLNNELQQFASEDGTPAAALKATEAQKPAAAKLAEQRTGKYTIQLGSYNSMEEAKQFAEGFTVRGYSPIINEVTIPSKGTWYRVSLGLFDNAQEAREYVKREASLFQGQDHVISEIK